MSRNVDWENRRCFFASNLIELQTSRHCWQFHLAYHYYCFGRTRRDSRDNRLFVSRYADNAPNTRARKKKNADTIYIRDLLRKQPFTRPEPKLSTCKTGYEKNRPTKKINDILMWQILLIQRNNSVKVSLIALYELKLIQRIIFTQILDRTLIIESFTVDRNDITQS